MPLAVKTRTIKTTKSFNLHISNFMTSLSKTCDVTNGLVSTEGNNRNIKRGIFIY